MATDPQSGRYSQPIVNGQSSESSLSSYSTGKTVYSTDSVLSSKLSSQPSSIVGSAKSQPNSSSSNASQRFPTSSISDQSRNFSSSQSSNSSSVNQSSSHSSGYKSSTDSYKPSDSYKQTSDSYKSQSDSYKSSADNYKTSTDGSKTDSYKSSTDSYKSPSDRTSATIGGSSATSAQNYKSDNTPNSSSTASNAYKSSNLDSSSSKPSSDVSQTRAPAPSQNNTTGGQSMRQPENRPVNNYQQSFQNQQRPNTASSNVQQNSSYQTPSNQPPNAGYQSSNYQQTQRPQQPPTVPQISRESSNASITRPGSAFSNQNATNQSFQRPNTAAPTSPATAPANAPQAQRPYSPNPPSAANQPPRPMSPSTPRPALNQQPGGPRPPGFQSNAPPRPLTPNYQQSTTVPTRANVNQRPNSTNQNLYSNTPNYGVNPPGARTGPLSTTPASGMYQRGGATSQPRYSDAGIRPLGSDPRLLGVLGSMRPTSPLSSYSMDKSISSYSSLLKNDQLPVDALSLQSGKLKNIVNRNFPGEKQSLADEILKIRQNLSIGETIGSYQKRIESEAAKSGAAKKSNAFSNFIQKDILKQIRENKKKLEAQKSEKNLLKQKSRKNLGEKKKKKRRVKKKKIVKRKKRKPEDPEDGEKKSEGDIADDKKPKGNGAGEDDDDEYEEVEIEVSEEEEVTDSEYEDDEDDDEEDAEPPSDEHASVTNSIKFFEKRDKAKKPVLPKFPVPFIPVEKKPKPDSLPVSSEPPEIIRSESIIKSDYKSGVDESPLVHPNLKKISDEIPKVAKINLDLIHKNRTDRSKSGNTVRYASQPNTPGKTLKRSKSKNNGRASYPGTPTKGKPSALKQHSSPGTPKKRMPPFNPEEELIRLFNDPTSKFFRRRWDGDHDNGVEENERRDHRPTTNGDLDSPKKTPSKLPGPTKKSMSATSPTKTPLKSPGTAKSLPKTPETPAPPTPLIKKVPMNKIQVGAAPSPNLKAVRSKIGSLANTTHRPGGGNVKIESHKVDFSKAQPRIAAKNDTYAPSGGDKKIQHVKLQWQAKPKVGSLDNAAYRPGGGDKKIESVKLDFKDKAKPKVGSKENVKHQPGGGVVKSSPSPKEGKSPNATEDGLQYYRKTLIALRWAMVRKTYSRMPPIESQKLEFKAQSKIGSLDNVKHKPGGGDVKIFDDKTYLKQISAANSEGRASGTQSVCDLSVVTEVHGSSKPGTPDHNTAIKIKKTTTIAKTRPEYKKTTEVTVVSRSPSKERKGNLVKSPSTHEVKLTYSKVASPTKHRNTDSENKGPVEIVNVPVKDHAPILKPGVDNKDASGLEIKNLIKNFEHQMNTGKDGQSQPSAGTDGKRTDNLPNVVQKKSDSNQNAQQSNDDSHQKSDKDDDKTKLDKNNKNDENLKKSSQGADGKPNLKDDIPISKFLQNEIAAHEKVGEIWKEVQNTGVEKPNLHNKPNPNQPQGQAPPPPPSNMSAPKPGYPPQNNPQQQPQQRPQMPQPPLLQQNQPGQPPNQQKPPNTQMNSNPSAQSLGLNQPSNPNQMPGNPNQPKPPQLQNTSQGPPPPGMSQGPMPGQPKPMSQMSSQPPQSQMKPPQGPPPMPGQKFPNMQPTNQQNTSLGSLGPNPSMTKPSQPMPGSLGSSNPSMQRLPNDLGPSSMSSSPQTGPGQSYHSVGDNLKNMVPKDSSSLSKYD